MNGISRLVCLVYVSKVATGLRPPRLAAIAAHSTQRNSKERITGVLVLAGRHFIQYLEGPDPAVRACFGRIERDLRHTDVTVKAFVPIRRRRFQDWGMGLFIGEPDHVVPVGPALLSWNDADLALLKAVEQIARRAVRAGLGGSGNIHMLPGDVFWNGLRRKQKVTSQISR